MKQVGGDNSNLTQAENIIIHNGISYVDAREIAIQVFKENFLIFQNKTKELVNNRATELIEKLFDKLSEQDIPAQSLNGVEIQSDIYEAQRIYAIKGDKQHMHVLTNALVEKIKRNDSLIDVIISESIKTLSKLTKLQLDLLGLIFLMNHYVSSEKQTIDDLCLAIQKSFSPLLEGQLKNVSNFQHLEFTGCGRYVEYHRPLWYSFLKKSPMLMTEYGFNPNENMKFGGNAYTDIDKNHNESKFINDVNQKNIWFLDFAKFWYTSPIKKMHLSTVGICIAITHINSQEIKDEYFDMKTWLIENDGNSWLNLIAL